MRLRHAVLTGAFVIALSGLTELSAQNRAAVGRYSLGDPYHLTGTYQLDRARSDNSQLIATRMTRTLGVNERDRTYRDLADRLEPPDEIAIDRTGRSITMISSNGPRITFDADGRDRTDWVDGAEITTHADMYGDELTIATTGARGQQYTVRFEPLSDGLRMTKQIDNASLRAPVVVQSMYRRVSDTARWDISSGAARTRDTRNPRNAGAAVPVGTRLTARLDSRLNANDIRDGQTFTMTVVDGRYRDATITGSVSRGTDRNDRVSLPMDFNRIQLTGGRSADFDGRIETVRTPDGRTVTVDSTGVLGERDRGSSTVQRGAIGAAIGGLIGALGWGGKGAAIGAVAGAAGLILIGNGPDASLPAGTEFTIVSMTPRYESER